MLPLLHGKLLRRPSSGFWLSFTPRRISPNWTALGHLRPASSIVPVRSSVAFPLGPLTTRAHEGVFSICAPTASVLPSDLRGLKYKSPIAS
jgi:hypothetical protein